jgi:hypothetical protein
MFFSQGGTLFSHSRQDELLSEAWGSVEQLALKPLGSAESDPRHPSKSKDGAHDSTLDPDGGAIRGA